MAAKKNNGYDGKYHFTLFIDSEKPKSDFVIERLRSLCEHYLKGLYTLKVFDLRKDQELFEEKRIFAAPTLEVLTPYSRKHRFVGDLSHSEMFIMAIGMGQSAIKMGMEASEMKQEAIRMRDSLKKA